MTEADERAVLAERFEAHRPHLRGVAYRMLGSLSEADDALQEAWLRVTRADTASVENLGGWLTTVVARVSLDMLRSRQSRREESLGSPTPSNTRAVMAPAASSDPEHEAILAESVGLALLVVLERLNPAERLAFVLHDMFAVPFDEIATIVGRTPTAARQLASRARRRVQGAGATPVPNAIVGEQRRVVDAFIAALRGGDFEALLAVLDPDLVVHVDTPAGPREVRGATAWARQAIAFSQHAQFIRAALVNGSVGAVWAPRGRLVRALLFTIADGRVSGVEVVTDRARLQELEIAIIPA